MPPQSFTTLALRLFALVAMLLALLTAAPAARAVTFIQQVQRLERIYGALLDLRPGAPPEVPPPGTPPLDLALEWIPVPSVDTRVGGKNEHLSPPPGIPRARLRADHAFGGGLGVMAGATYAPPLTLDGYTADWLGGEAGASLRLGLVTLAARAYALSATVEGPITGGSSADRYTLVTQGADLRAGIAPGPWRAYLGAGGGSLDALLRVGDDGSRIRERGSQAYWLGGAAYVSGRWRWVLEQEVTGDYLRNVILGVSWRY